MARGKLIVIDGGEGSGKTSVVNFLKQNLSPLDFIFTREPGGTPFAEDIRSLMIGDGATHVSGETQFGLAWAARADHFKNLILPSIESGQNIISDRFDSSTYAYQLYGQDALYLKGLFNEVRKIFLDKCEPDLYIILDLPTNVAGGRVRQRSETSNHFDDQSKDFHERVRVGYLDFIKDKKHIVIDATRSLEAVCEEVLINIKNICQ